MADRGKRLSNDTPLLVAAARDRNLPLVMQLVQQGEPIDARDNNGATALYWACCRGYDEISQFLLNAGSDINARVIWGATALLAAADNGQDVCVKQLLQEKIDVNATNDRGDTALHVAAYRGYVSILKLLMEAKANPFLKNSASMTPLQEARAQGQDECLNLLQQYMDVRPGYPGSICLSNPDLSFITSYPLSMEESHKSWPYIPASNNSSRLPSENRKDKAFSLRLPRINSICDNDGDAVSVCSGSSAAVIPNTGKSVNSQSTLEPVNNQNRESPSSSSLTESCFRDSIIVDSSSFSDMVDEGDSGTSSFNSLLSKAVPIISKSGGQVKHRTYGKPSSPVSSNFNQRIETVDIPKKIDTIQECEKQYKISQPLPSAPTFRPQDTVNNPCDSFDRNKKWCLSELAATQNFPPPFNLLPPAFEKRNSRKTQNVIKQVLPGVNVGEFVEQLQLQMIDMQQNLIKSNILITHLREELLGVHRENAELKAQNSALRNLFSQNEPFSLRARGVSGSTDDLKYVSCLPEQFQSMAYIAERDNHDVSAGSRCAVESNEDES